ncbi:MAG TPA: lipid II flippase MurJ [Methylotenera sp.]|nr:lipid II flippase MurJ [Methylotenera sp.]HPH04521.1 lipid II flippase MurJ [Methylotenera sp.]HPN01185.1 lipid II flippase MurJ [Methylotenera sp.]
MKRKQSGFLSAGLALSLALFAGRLAGLVREIELAKIFGIGADADIAVLLLSIPDLFVNLLISGGISAALVPRFLELNLNQSAALFRQITLLLAIFFIPMGMLVFILPDFVFKVFAPGINLPASLTWISIAAVAIAIPLTGLAGVFSAYLNSKNFYFIAGCGTLIFNLIIILALQLYNHSTLFPQGQNKFLLLCLGIGVGAFLRWLSLLVILPKYETNKQESLVDRALVRSFFYAAFSASILLIAPILIRAMASLTGEGAIAAFNYTQKLIELPVGIFFASFATVALTKMSQAFAENNTNYCLNVFNQQTQNSICFAMVILALGLWFSEPIVQIIYARGDFDEAATQRIAQLFKIGLLSLPMIATCMMATTYLNASKNNFKVLKVGLLSLLILPFLAVPGLLNNSETQLMYAVVLFHGINAIALLIVIKQKIFGRNALLSVNLIACILLTLVPAIIVMLIDYLLHIYNVWTRFALLLIGFAFSSYLILRLFRGKI